MVKILTLALSALLLPGALWAQQNMTLEDYIQLVRSDLKATKKELIVKNMKFSETESKDFWPVYQEYDKDLVKINDAKVQIIKEYARYYELGTLLPTVAEDLSRRSFKVQKDLITLREKYFDQFKKVMPAPKVARFFQIDNKFQAVVDFQLAVEIPLAE